MFLLTSKHGNTEQEDVSAYLYGNTKWTDVFVYFKWKDVSAYLSFYMGTLNGRTFLLTSIYGITGWMDVSAYLNMGTLNGRMFLLVLTSI